MAFLHRLHLRVSRNSVFETGSCSWDAVIPHWKSPEFCSVSRWTTLLSLCWYMVFPPQPCSCCLSVSKFDQCSGSRSCSSETSSSESEVELLLEEDEELSCFSDCSPWGLSRQSSLVGSPTMPLCVLSGCRAPTVTDPTPTRLSQDLLKSAERCC